MIRWWCSGQVAVPWDWTPRPYLGIWLVMAGLAIGYLGMARRGGPVVEERASRGQLAAFSIGWVLLWASTDWPIGTLAAGYLLTASMVQIVLYYYVVAPLFVYGIPRRIRTRWLEGRYAAPLRMVVRRPPIAFALLTVTLVVTHLPPVADSLKALQLGTMLMDVSWLLSAFLYWWALDAYRPGNNDVRLGTRLLYVFGSKVVPTVLGVILTFHNFPLYTTYEFANRAFAGFSAVDDQQAAGVLMWEGMAPLLLVRLALVFREAFIAGETPPTPESGDGGEGCVRGGH